MAVLRLQPRVIALAHRAFHLRGAPAQGVTLAACTRGDLSLVHADGVQTLHAPAVSELNDICLHPHRPMFACIDKHSGELTIADFDGNALCTFEPEVRREDRHFTEGTGYLACMFSNDGAHLWTAQVESDEAIRVKVYQSDDWSLRASVVVQDPLGESICGLQPTPDPKMFALYFAAGQDGQQLSWLKWSQSTVTCVEEPALGDCSGPAFAPGGEQFLVLDADNTEVRKFSFPRVAQLASCASAFENEEMFGYYLSDIDEQHALVNSNTDRIYVLQTESMRIIHELAIAGHEPRPTEQVYPRLIGEKALCTDIAHFNTIGAQCVFVARRDKSESLENWQDDLLFVNNADISDRIAAAKNI